MEMSNAGGITEQVFGLDLLSENKMKPWWETIHGYLLAATITASGLIVYFTSTGQQVDCLPISENASLLSDSQINLINGYCTGEIPWYAVYAGILNFIAASLILVASNVWLNHPDVIDAFRTFVKAANIINGLHSRSKNLNQMAVRPIFAEHGEAFELRKACLLLWSHPNKIRRQYSFRNIFVISVTLLALAGAVTVAVLMSNLVIYPHFDCSLSDTVKERLHMALNGGFDYFCSYNYAKITFPFVLLCGGAFAGQITALVLATFMLRPQNISPLDRDTLSDDFLQAKAFSHFMKVFWTNASPVDSQRFGGLLSFMFSRVAVTSMVRFIPMAVTNMDTIKEENDFPPPYKGPKYRYRSIPNPDLTYIEMYVHMHQYGGNNALSKLIKVFESRDFGNGYHDINEALGKLKFTKWDDDAKRFVREAGDKKYWDLLVNIINSYDDRKPDHPHLRRLNCDYYDFNFEEKQEGREDKGNLLYYAFRKEEGESDFSNTAIKHILACNKGKGKLLVHDGKFSMLAEEYVISQYEKDPTFSEELKLKLLSMIKESEEPDSKFSTAK